MADQESTFADFFKAIADAKNVYFWLRRDGTDIVGTTRIITITGNGVYRNFEIVNTLSL